MTQAGVQTKRVHSGRLFSVDAVSWRDEQGRLIERDIVRHPGAVLIVPVLDGERIILIRNWRIAVEQRLYELPAGTAEAGEPPIETARRELIEETGYRAEVVLPLGEFYTSPGFADEIMHVFVAMDLEQVGQAPEPHESIEVEIVPVSRALAMIDDGRIRDGKTIAGLLMWVRRVGDGAST